PISNDPLEARKLESYKNQLRVAYCMRFLPISNFVKNELDRDSIFKISFKRSYYLPNWHPYADYTKEYTARKSLGGGIIRTLSHEIDLAVHWLGQPTIVNGIVDKLSNLQLDVDDFAFFSCKS
ncbi:gfo/Idh/MocA family oxidoreductase, partial [Verrucomicrobia bacterium]|nr:gfo/Idh/MocA family oxidoreductase [Verrucomicrobiota bacterium]